MTSSTSSFISAALLLAACAGARPAPPRATPLATVAVLPVANLSAASVPLKEVQAAVEAALAAHSIAATPAERVDQFLARHRLRWTGGVDADSAKAAHDELGVAGVLLTTVELYDGASPPRFAVSMRLVDEAAQIRWTDGASLAGDESPGLFELGIVRALPELRDRVLGRLAASLAASLEGRGPHASKCAWSGRFAPKESFRSPDLNAQRTWTVAVLPFVNETDRRLAGELVSLQFARQLEASGRFNVVEPGVLREDLLRFRIVMESGVSLDIARIVLELVQADFVVAGYVRDYADLGGGIPQVQFTAMMLDRRNSEVVWEASSWSRGDDGVFFFDSGQIATMPDLLCRMARASIDDALVPRRDAPRLAMPSKR